jgi:outer membrane lipoprotein SlyB
MDNRMNEIIAKRYKLLFVPITASLLLLTSCAATQMAIEHRNLETQTRLSKTIFLEPVENSQKTIFISVKNTSDQTLDLNGSLKDAFRAKGYRVVNSPDSAHYLLQANILTVSKMSQAASHEALGGGFGSALAGGAAGAGLGALTGNSNAMIGGGIAGGLVGLAADSLVKDVNYSMITDIQISERVGRGIKVNETHHASLSQGSASRLTQTSTRDSQFERFRTRIVSNANKVNLSFKDANEALKAGLVNTLAGIF